MPLKRPSAAARTQRPIPPACPRKAPASQKNPIRTNRFPNPKALTQTLHDMDVRLMVSIWPNMNPVTRDNAAFREKGWLLPGGELLDHFTRENEWLVFVQREFWRREYLIDNQRETGHHSAASQEIKQ